LGEGLPRRRSNKPPEPELLIALSPAPHLPIADPKESAACHHVIFFAMARKITFCAFIARSIAACA